MELRSVPAPWTSGLDNRTAQVAGGLISPKDFLARAILRVRCIGCGDVILAARYVDGRPLAMERAKGDRLNPDRHMRRGWEFKWLDRGHVAHGRCHCRRYP